jgi:GNAT superfamily N-acetyltransferase
VTFPFHDKRLPSFCKNVRPNPGPFVIESFAGTRSDLLPLFAQADDSLDEIKTYIDDGEVLVARRGEQLLELVQSIATGQDWEIKSVAVLASERGCGIGTSLIRAALKLHGPLARVAFFLQRQRRIYRICASTNASVFVWNVWSETFSVLSGDIRHWKWMEFHFAIESGYSWTLLAD